MGVLWNTIRFFSCMFFWQCFLSKKIYWHIFHLPRQLFLLFVLSVCNPKSFFQAAIVSDSNPLDKPFCSVTRLILTIKFVCAIITLHFFSADQLIKSIWTWRKTYCYTESWHSLTRKKFPLLDLKQPRQNSHYVFNRKDNRLWYQYLRISFWDFILSVVIDKEQFIWDIEFEVATKIGSWICESILSCRHETFWKLRANITFSLIFYV